MSLSRSQLDSMFRLELRGEIAGHYKLGPVESSYVRMRDGVRLALDVVRPMGDSTETKRNTILVMTRYWRGKKGSLSNCYAEMFVQHGYAVVVGDVRGTGASFGVWPGYRSRSEILDNSEVLDWIVAQPWSTGQVVGYGVSYTANSADWMAEQNHPAVKGIVPRFADYSVYEDLSFPGGVPNQVMDLWDSGVKSLDRNESIRDDGSLSQLGVRPVGPGGEADLVAALRDHERAPTDWVKAHELTFKDERPTLWDGATILDWTPEMAAERISKSGIPTQNWASWFDSGSAQGAVRRFLLQSNPMNVIIGPWNHGGAIPYDPLRPADEEILPTFATQQANDIRFAEACFNGEAARVGGKVVHYYTVGEGAWKSTTSWPPEARRRRWYMSSGSRLDSSPDAAGFDFLQVDRDLGDVLTNRWDTNGGSGGKVDYGDRRQFDEARLTYTSEPLANDLEITGHPFVELNISSTREDGNFFVYLEAVQPDGVSRYLTEGQLRVLHRKVWTNSPFDVLGPQHSFLERDAEPLTPGEIATLTFTLHPISARLSVGYRLRVVLAGSDKTSFANVPADGEPPLLKFYRGPGGCFIDLPIVEK